MYSPRLYKHRDSYVLYIPTVHAFGSLSLTHTLLVQTNIHDDSTPCLFVIFITDIYIFYHPKCSTNASVVHVHKKTAKVHNDTFFTTLNIHSTQIPFACRSEMKLYGLMKQVYPCLSSSTPC